MKKFILTTEQLQVYTDSKGHGLDATVFLGIIEANDSIEARKLWVEKNPQIELTTDNITAQDITNVNYDIISPVRRW